MGVVLGTLLFGGSLLISDVFISFGRFRTFDSTFCFSETSLFRDVADVAELQFTPLDVVRAPVPDEDFLADALSRSVDVVVGIE